MNATSNSATMTLFSSGSLVSVLQDRSQWAIRSFIESYGDWHYDALIDALIKRAKFEPLEIDLSIDPCVVEGRRNDRRSAFAIPYCGDPFLWFLSPLPLEVTVALDTGGDRVELAGGLLAKNPSGEVSGNYLHLVCPEDELQSQIGQIENMLVFQRQALWISEQALELHMQAIACPPEWKHDWAKD